VAPTAILRREAPETADLPLPFCQAPEITGTREVHPEATEVHPEVQETTEVRVVQPEAREATGVRVVPPEAQEATEVPEAHPGHHHLAA